MQVLVRKRVQMKSSLMVRIGIKPLGNSSSVSLSNGQEDVRLNNMCVLRRQCDTTKSLGLRKSAKCHARSPGYLLRQLYAENRYNSLGRVRYECHGDTARARV